MKAVELMNKADRCLFDYTITRQSAVHACRYSAKHAPTKRIGREAGKLAHVIANSKYQYFKTNGFSFTATDRLSRYGRSVVIITPRSFREMSRSLQADILNDPYSYNFWKVSKAFEYLSNYNDYENISFTNTLDSGYGDGYDFLDLWKQGEIPSDHKNYQYYRDRLHYQGLYYVTNTGLRKANVKDLLDLLHDSLRPNAFVGPVDNQPLPEI